MATAEPATVDELAHRVALFSSRGDAKIIQGLLHQGASFNTKDHEGNTPLHFAVSGNHKDVVDILLLGNADPIAENDVGLTPLHLALYNHRTAVVRELIYRVRPSYLHSRFGEEEESLFHTVVRCDNSQDADLVELFLAIGCDPLQRSKSGVTPYDIALRRRYPSAVYLNNYLMNRTIWLSTAAVDDYNCDQRRQALREQLSEGLASGNPVFVSTCAARKAAVAARLVERGDDGEYRLTPVILAELNMLWYRKGLDDVRSALAFW